MPVRVSDRTPEMLAAMNQAVRAGLDATATELRDAVKAKHYSVNYYRGGAFRSTLQVVEHITKTMPEKRGPYWEVKVGVKFMEALYWELGHFNIFLRRWVRVELWKPTLLEQTTYLNGLFGRTVVRILEHSVRGRA